MMGKELEESAAPTESLLVGRYRFSRSVCYRIDATKLDDFVTSRGPPARSQSHGCSSSSHEAEAVLPPRVSYKKSMSGPVSYDDQCAAAAAARSKTIPALSHATSPNTSTSGRKGKELRRLLSWSAYLDPVGDEQAIEQAEEWMVDLSQLFLGQRFASGAHSRLYHGMYQGKAVAVKVTRHPQGKDEELGSTLDRLFTREVSLLSRLRHPNIVQLIGACKKPPVCCIVTRYVPGGSLRDFLHKSGGGSSSLPLSTALRMALDIGRGMHYLHSQGVVHRDLKSQNLILDDDLSIKITDFGVARLESECDSVTCDVGTYRWMAPEMVNRRAHSRKVDVYSFGIVLWELLTGKLPFEEMTPIQAAYAVVHKHARPQVPSDCPPLLTQLMQHCWSFNPDKRPEFEHLVQRLEQFQASTVVPNQCQCFTH